MNNKHGKFTLKFMVKVWNLKKIIINTVIF